MNGTTGSKERYVAEYGLNRDRLPGGAAWLRTLREAALARFDEVGFPTPRQEEWKYTSVAPIEKRYFGPAGGAPAVAASAVPDFDGYVAVFVNGAFDAARSRLAGLPAGVTVAPLSEALERSAEELEPWLGRLADTQANGFVALNTALMVDGAYIRIAPGVRLEKPLLLAYTAVSPGDAIMIQPRNLLVAGDGSEIQLVEAYSGDGVYLTNAVTEISAGAGAGVEHCKVQQESESAYHIATVQVRQGRDSRFTSRNFSLGGRLVRNDINTVLAAPGAGCTLDGLYMAAGRQHVDNHTFIDHAVPHCSSSETYKGVVDGRARAVFNGHIMVRRDAQKTDAHQSNHNLLLSLDAEADAKPQLEIYADDVRCSHGATVGFLDADALFYLRSRGLAEQEARSLLTYAFTRELIDRVAIADVRRAMEREVLRHLPGGTASVHGFPGV